MFKLHFFNDYTADMCTALVHDTKINYKIKIA